MGNDTKRWSTKRAHSFSRDVGILDNDRRLIAEVFTLIGGTYRVNAYVRAANIVRAVNAHDDLVWALKAVEWVIDDLRGKNAWTCPYCSGLKMGRGHTKTCKLAAAIALATEATDDNPAA